jgi:hypothetical protein
MAILSFHAGELSAGESFAAALARGLDITGGELKNALTPDNPDPLDLGSLMVEKLNDLSTARGGSPIAENGSLILERSREDDDRCSGLEMLDQLYDEIPDALKERHDLLPRLGDYFVNARDPAMCAR